MLTDHSLYARLAVASGKLRAVTDKEIDGVVCAFGTVGDGITALRRAARADKETFFAGALDGLVDFGRSGFVFRFDANHALNPFVVFFQLIKIYHSGLCQL